MKKFTHFNQLSTLNRRYFKKEKNVRIDYDTIFDIENRLKILLEYMTKIDKSLEEKIELLLNTMGYILSVQPFYDMNTRTIKKYIEIILKSLSLSIIFPKEEYIIPILFNGEKCTLEEISRFKRHIYCKK